MLGLGKIFKGIGFPRKPRIISEVSGFDIQVEFKNGGYVDGRYVNYYYEVTIRPDGTNNEYPNVKPMKMKFGIAGDEKACGLTSKIGIFEKNYKIQEIRLEQMDSYARGVRLSPKTPVVYKTLILKAVASEGNKISSLFVNDGVSWVHKDYWHGYLDSHGDSPYWGSSARGMTPIPA